ncbi:hypothetical protein ACIRBX_12015 [Kitasatospora sp. NPDC096147]|uniref:hypothetical protein n=1 Tax=Kitasatospora sp. NPDC096147 TaxID=3364093 RepID=UPI00382CE1F4
MNSLQILGYAGTAASITAALVMVRASWQINTARLWREEAEAQKTRADRLQADMTEIKERLARLEVENARLVQLLTQLSPEQLRFHI